MEYKHRKIRWNQGGSIINRIAESQPTVPVVGEGATKLSYTDRTAYYVTHVSKSGKEVTLQRAKVKCLDYYAGRYNVQPDPEGYEVNLYYRWGAWRTKHYFREDGTGQYYWSLFNVAFGDANEYEDPHF